MMHVEMNFQRLRAASDSRLCHLRRVLRQTDEQRQTLAGEKVEKLVHGCLPRLNDTGG